MGLSSSQARLLSLTGRQHDIEYKAQKLEAQKLEMANESTQVYSEYEDALNATKIQYRTVGADGASNYVNATYQSMIDNSYLIQFGNRTVVNQTAANNYVAASGSKDYFIALQTGRVTTSNMVVGGTTEVYTADQFMHMSSSGSYRLMSDIDMTGKSYSSQSLTGITLDGNGHSITGLKTALFSNLSGSTVSNLNVSGDVTSSSILAESIGSNTNISNVTVSGNVNSTSGPTGALIASASGSNINISQCSSSASVTSTGSAVGDLIGTLSGGNVTNCSSSGNVTALSFAGGLIGVADSSTISNSTTTSNVTLVGPEINTAIDSGGFIGVAVATNISNCSSYGTMNNTRSGSGVTHTVAGFVGATGGVGTTISNCDSYSDVNAITDYVAGFIGCANTSISISNCNSYGDLQGTIIGGFIYAGAGAGTINNCYTSDTTDTFSSSGLTVTNTQTTPISNVITVTPPSVSITTPISNSDTSTIGALFDLMSQGFVVSDDTSNPAKGHENDSTWFTNMVNAGELFIYQYDTTNKKYAQTNVSTNTSFQEVSDDTNIKKAEAKYESAMAKIDAKDKKFDTDIAELDTERSAIKTEIDTLKTVSKDNVDRTFKLFS